MLPRWITTKRLQPALRKAAAAAVEFYRIGLAMVELLVGIAPAGEPPTPPGPWETTSTAALSQRWRATYLQLDRDPNPIARASITQARRDLLTELQRRDPTGFARFLASRDPAGRYPLRFCRDVRGNRPGHRASQRPVDTATPHGPESVQGRRRRHLP